MLGAEYFWFWFFQPLFRATHRKKSTPKSRKWFESNPVPRFGFQPKTNFELPSSSSKEKLVFGRDFLGRRFSILFNFLTSKRQIRKKSTIFIAHLAVISSSAMLIAPTWWLYKLHANPSFLLFFLGFLKIVDLDEIPCCSCISFSNSGQWLPFLLFCVFFSLPPD